MKLLFLIYLFVLNFFFINSVFGQSKYTENYSQKNFEKNTIYNQTFHLWQYKNKWIPKKNDTLVNSFFVDDRNYKGLINYGVTFRSKDVRVFNYWEGHHMRFLNVEFGNVIFYPKDSIIEIDGYITGGWDDALKKLKHENSIENTIKVFLGEKTDTILPLYYNNIVSQELIEVKFKNKVINESTILDIFPAFYFKKNYYNQTTINGRKKATEKRAFKIKGKVTKNTLLAFGGNNCYSVIFDIGAMVYSPNKNKRNKIKKETQEFKSLIVNNVLLSDIEKEKAKESKYYTYTEKAESYIIRKQFAQAKLAYLELINDYPILYARDIHNAIRSSVLSRDMKTAFMFGEKLATKGVKLSYFNAKIFSNLKKNVEWKYFSKKYDSIYDINQSKFSHSLRKELEELTIEDQNDYGLETRKEPKILFETTERVTDKLIALLKKEGFHSEEKIGVYTINDTILVSSPNFNVLIRHAVQQEPKNLNILNELLKKAEENIEFDKKRSSIYSFYNNSCYHIYKGNLYQDKSCSGNEIIIKKIMFQFKNTNNFIIDRGNYIISEYNKESPENRDEFYENFKFITKLSDDWFFYEK